MKILGIPLDIRPYNYDFLQDLADFDSNIKLTLPPKDSLGYKKTPGDTKKLSAYLVEHSSHHDALIVSVDMLIYGGLFPARVHNKEVAKLLEDLDNLRLVKELNPNLKIYASSLILRTPQYNSSEEEPSYYAKYGLDIYKCGYYEDKEQRDGLSASEKADFDRLKVEVPEDNILDFTGRRGKNILVIKELLKLVEEGIVEMLIIPQDDASEYGYTAMDQREIYYEIDKLGVEDKVFLHPGTDESGCTLLTRAYTDWKGSLDLEVFYNVLDFESLIPNYEDRPFKYSLISHSRAMGLNPVRDNGDIFLGINGASEKMQEAFTALHGIDIHGEMTIIKAELRKDINYYRCHDNIGFVNKLKTLVAQGKSVGVADLAYSNGGDTSFIKRLDTNELIEKLSAYAGWNTTCNSLGTALAMLVFSHNGDNPKAKDLFLAKRLISDWAYQSEVRFDIQLNKLKEYGATCYDFNHHDEEILTEIKNTVMEVFRGNINNAFKNLEVIAVEAPFKRMSGLNFKIII